MSSLSIENDVFLIFTLTHSLTLSHPDVRICCDDAILFFLCIKFAYMTMNVKSQQCSFSQRKRIHRCTPTAYYIYKVDDFYVHTRVCWHIKFNFCAFLCVSTKHNVALHSLRSHKRCKIFI